MRINIYAHLIIIVILDEIYVRAQNWLYTKFSILYTAVLQLYIDYIEVLFVKVTLFVLILFASLPDCGQNETAVSDEQYSLSDF
jgi:hypothetical protein